MHLDGINSWRVEYYSREDMKTYKDALDLVGKKQPVCIFGLHTAITFNKEDIAKVLNLTDEQCFAFYYKSKLEQ